ncbi:MAG TPA: hypothetical protein VLB01_02040, partial [Thermodesulfobacteriota bacterium]|nr:hypothetical protein [Thermodesulfobacteriota bacterium]
FFINHFDLIDDDLHPNGLGTKVMAYLWRNSLLGQSGLPFLLANLSLKSYKQNLLEAGDQYYIDRTYTLSSIPSELKVKDGIVWIMTAKGNSSNTSESFLSFKINLSSTVYVAYDSRATSLPNWLANRFVSTGSSLKTKDPEVGTFRLYKANFGAGTLTLGGNMAAGARFPSGVSGTNYIVIVKKN